MAEERSRGGRHEDARFVTGAGRYVGDFRPDGLLHACFVRAPIARGRIVGVEVAPAREVPGVVAVYLAADLAEDGLTAPTAEALPRDDGGTPHPTPRPFLCADEIRYAGEPVAVVIADSVTAAEDAAEQVDVSVDETACVTTAADALARGAPTLWPGARDNIAFVRRAGDADAVERAMAGAAHRVSLDLDVSRVVAAPMEPRGVLAQPGEDGTLTLVTSSQSPHGLRAILANDVFRVDADAIRVIAPDVGGSFGMKAGAYREDVVVAWAARRLGRAVRWVSERSEAFLADEHGRDVATRAELALDSDGTFTALRVRCLANIGAYASKRSMVVFGNIGGVAGVYRTPAISAEVTGVFTNTSPTAPYRGAGRPEATYAIERLIDVAAAELGVSPYELRRRNLIPAEAMPFQTGLTFRYDCGDFAATMQRSAVLSDLDGFPRRREQSAAAGRLRGIGIANPIEVAGGPFTAVRGDHAWLSIRSDGSAELWAGVMSVGQGHETTFPRLVAEALGLDEETVSYVQGDTERVPEGRGSGGSAGLCIGGAAVVAAVDAVVEAGKEIAADHLEAAARDIVFEAGRFSVTGTDLSVTLQEVAALAEARRAEGLVGSAKFTPPSVTYPNGCHVCEVEIDPETGAVALLNYTAVEDVGRVFNQVFVDGQIQGGIAQGVGQALGEKIHYDRGTGQLVTGSFMDYQMPRAGDMPRMRLESLEVPTAVNPLGAKGVGEAGTVGALAATMNAICDALAPLGIRHVDMPATPARIWQAIAAARRQSQSRP